MLIMWLIERGTERQRDKGTERQGDKGKWTHGEED